MSHSETFNQDKLIHFKDYTFHTDLLLEVTEPFWIGESLTRESGSDIIAFKVKQYGMDDAIISAPDKHTLHTIRAELLNTIKDLRGCLDTL